jgi:hypothetical protein
LCKNFSDSRKKGQPEGWPAMVRLTDENIAGFFPAMPAYFLM